MTRFLKSREICPIHHSYFCVPCHKPQKKFPASTWGKRGELSRTPLARSPRRFPSPAVMRIEDATVPRGYREECNARELKRRKDQKIHEQGGCCYLCGEKFENYRDVECCHKRSKGMGGAYHDDHIENLFAGHRWCNREQGSREVA
jgi:hypothetical protein